MFPKIGVPQNGWFIMENPMNKWMIWGVFPLFLETPNRLYTVSLMYIPYIYKHLLTGSDSLQKTRSGFGTARNEPFKTKTTTTITVFKGSGQIIATSHDLTLNGG